MTHTRKTILALLILLLLPACATVSEVPTSTAVIPATAILPPTEPALTVPAEIPPTVSPAADPSAASCKDEAIFVEDVTYPDNTRLTTGEQFTKTWKLQNTGTCTWTGYTVAFVSGDRMEAPDSVPVPETEAKSTVDVSMDLITPSTDGSYTANFELRDAAGKSVPIGMEATFWVKVIVGEAGDPLGVEQRIGNCTSTENPEYVKQMIALINKTRGEEGRKPLTINAKLTTVAQAHSLDMACSGSKFLLHSGTDGLWTGERLSRVGYSSPYYFELLAIGLPQDAMNEWRRHENQWPAVIDSYVTEMGVGYVFSELSTYGGYWTVVLGRPE